MTLFASLTFSFCFLCSFVFGYYFVINFICLFTFAYVMSVFCCLFVCFFHRDLFSNSISYLPANVFSNQKNLEYLYVTEVILITLNDI